MNKQTLLKMGLPATLLAALAVLWLWLDASSVTDSEVPTADWSALEAPVSERLQALREAVIRSDGLPQQWGELAMAYHAHGLLEQASRCYARAQAGAPGEARWPYLRGLALESTDPAAAEQAYEQAIAIDATNPAMQLRYAGLLQDLQRPAEAREHYQAALAASPGMPHALLGLARLELSGGDTVAAGRAIEQVLAAAPQLGQAWRLRAELLDAQGQRQEARRSRAEAARRAEPLPPDDPVVSEMQAYAMDSGARLRQARRVLEQGRSGEAVGLIQEIIDLRPDYADAYAAMGDAQAALKQWDRARWALERALDLGRQPPATYLRLADTLNRLNQDARASSILRKGVTAHPDDADLALAAAQSEWEREQFAAAAELYRQVLALDPERAIAHHRLAQWAQRGGQADQAIEGWRDALALEPGLAEARYALAEALIAQGNHQEAVDTLLTGLELDAQDSRCSMLLAWELSTAPQDTLRDGARALQLGQAAYESEPGNPRAADVYAAALAESGQFARAVDIANKAMDVIGYLDRQDYAEEIRRRRDGYQRSQPYRQPL